MAYRQHIIKKLRVRLKARVNYNVFHSLLLSWGHANWVALTLNSDLHLAIQAIPHGQEIMKVRSVFLGSVVQYKVLCVHARDLPGLTSCVLHKAPSLALWDPALLSLMCWVEVEALHCKQSFQVKSKKLNNRKVRFYIRIQVSAIERLGKKKK